MDSASSSSSSSAPSTAATTATTAAAAAAPTSSSALHLDGVSTGETADDGAMLAAAVVSAPSAASEEEPAVIRRVNSNLSVNKCFDDEEDEDGDGDKRSSQLGDAFDDEDEDAARAAAAATAQAAADLAEAEAEARAEVESALSAAMNSSTLSTNGEEEESDRHMTLTLSSVGATPTSSEPATQAQSQTQTQAQAAATQASSAIPAASEALPVPASASKSPAEATSPPISSPSGIKKARPSSVIDDVEGDSEPVRRMTVLAQHSRDYDSPCCLRCGRRFQLGRARHRCYACGVSVCNDCSSDRLPLKKQVRVCSSCYMINKNRSKVSVDLKPAPITLFTGYLHKEGSAVRSWKNRFFALDSNGHLAYYKTPNFNTDRMLGLIPLDVSMCVEGGKNDRRWPSAALPEQQLLIHTQDRTYYLYAPTAEQAKEWSYVLHLVAGMCFACHTRVFPKFGPDDECSSEDLCAVYGRERPKVFHLSCFKCCASGREIFPINSSARVATIQVMGDNIMFPSNPPKEGSVLEKAALLDNNQLQAHLKKVFEVMSSHLAETLLLGTEDNSGGHSAYTISSHPNECDEADETHTNSPSLLSPSASSSQSLGSSTASFHNPHAASAGPSGSSSSSLTTATSSSSALGVASTTSSSAAAATSSTSPATPLSPSAPSHAAAVSSPAPGAGADNSSTPVSRPHRLSSISNMLSPSSSSSSASAASASAAKSKAKPSPAMEVIKFAVFGLHHSLSSVRRRESDKAAPKELEPTFSREILLNGETNSFECTSFCPGLFAKMREAYDISLPLYLESFELVPGPERAIGGGRSGSFVTATHDGRFIIKTMSGQECNLLQSILPRYVDYMVQTKGSLLTRYFGMHQIIRKGHKPLIFMVMDNILGKASGVPGKAEKITLDEIYDLKGSYVDRRSISQKSALPSDFKGTRKDMDLRRPLTFTERGKQILSGQMSLDVSFLNELGLMDYSLLVGIHNCRPDGSCCVMRKEMENSVIEGGLLRGRHIVQIGLRGGGPTDDTESVYFIGIIDLLQQWNAAKKTESFIKSTLFKKDVYGISAVNPDEYAQRFMDSLPTRFKTISDQMSRRLSILNE